jgi:hypothetical protein
MLIHKAKVSEVFLESNGGWMVFKHFMVENFPVSVQIGHSVAQSLHCPCLEIHNSSQLRWFWNEEGNDPPISKSASLVFNFSAPELFEISTNEFFKAEPIVAVPVPGH